MVDLPHDLRKAATAVGTRLREILADPAGRGLDRIVEEAEDLLASVWLVENAGVFRKKEAERDVLCRLVATFQSELKKIAPPPPKKIKHAAPLRRILPLSPTSIAKGFNIAMMLRALAETGDFTKQTDKAREATIHFLDDWRRMMWESARVTGWAQGRELAKADTGLAARVPGTRFSMLACLAYMEALAKRREDLITPIPPVSMIACQGCDRFDGRERVRCQTCERLFCSRCMSRSTTQCLPDYSVRYLKHALELRTFLADAARAVCQKHRLDEFTRNDRFAKALAAEGIDVVFHEAHSDEAAENIDGKGAVHLRVRDRENTTVKRSLYAALARAHFRAAEMESDPELIAYFVDICLGIPIETALQKPAQAVTPVTT